MNSELRFAAVLLVAIGAAASQADIAYNNFASDGSFDTQDNWAISPTQYLAMPFTSATTGSVTDVIAALGGGGGEQYTVYLELDDNGLNPGTVLESWTFADPGPPVTLVGDGSASLVAGDNYWLEITPATEYDFNGWWWWNNVGATGTSLYTSGGTWYSSDGPLCVFRVDTTATPEPISLSVLGFGLVGVIARRRGR